MTEYTPSNMLKVCAVWAMWRKWCDYFYNIEEYDDDRLSRWHNDVMCLVKQELIMKLVEAPAVLQWIQVLGDRRENNREIDRAHRMPEKEFLLTQAQSIVANPDRPFELADLTEWIGNSVFCYRRDEKMIINHAVWTQWTEGQEEQWEPTDTEEQEAQWIQADY